MNPLQRLPMWKETVEFQSLLCSPFFHLLRPPPKPAGLVAEPHTPARSSGSHQDWPGRDAYPVGVVDRAPGRVPASPGRVGKSRLGCSLSRHLPREGTAMA